MGQTLSFDDDFKTEKIPIPNRTYPLNKKNCKEIIEYYKSNSFVKKIIDSTTHVSFSTFIENLIKSIKKFEETISNEDFLLYIPFPDSELIKNIKEKSNYWASQLVYHILKKKPIKIISKIPDDYYNNEKTNILLCDDGIFGGNQMFSVLKDLKKDNFNFKIFMLIPYASSHGKNVCSEQKIDEKTMKMEIKFFDVVEMHSPIYGRYPVYFDHKLPDNASSHYTLYCCGCFTESVFSDEKEKCEGVPKKCLLQSISLTDSTNVLECNTKEDITSIKTGKTTNCPVVPYKDRNSLFNPHISYLEPKDYINFVSTIVSKKDSGKIKPKKSLKKQKKSLKIKKKQG